MQVPQSYSADIKPGMTASFTVPEYPGRIFTATLAASADAITPQTGTLLVQLQIDNADRRAEARRLRPGPLQPAAPGRRRSRSPASALMFRDAGMSVAVVGPDGRVAMKPVTIGRDLGPTVEIASGLTAADRVIDNPPDSLRPGDRVRIAVRGTSARRRAAMRLG